MIFEKRQQNKKERKMKCYIFKTKGHAFWACESRKKIAGLEAKHDIEITEKLIAEERLYPEAVHVIGDYMVEDTNGQTWNEIWYVSKQYKYHMCPRRKLFNDVEYKFKMMGREENERKFIFSYGIGNVTIKTKNGDLIVSHVQYTPEVSLNLLSLELLETQGFSVKIKDRVCSIYYMYDEEPSLKLPLRDETEKVGPKEIVNEHNDYMQKYFESIDPGDDCSIIRGLEDLDWNKDITQDYVDEEYLSYNGTLYALKVNSFSRFLSFMNWIKQESIWSDVRR